MGLIVKHMFKKTAITLAALSLAPVLSAHAASTFDPTINRLFITSVNVNGSTYQNVSATVNSYSLLGVDSGTPGTDSFNPTTNLLTLGSVVFLGTTYSNVRVQLNSFTLLAATLLTSTPGTPTPTPSPTPTPTPAPTPTPTPTPTPPSSGGTLTAANTCNLSNFQTDLLAAINQARASSRSCGATVFPAVAAVTWNGQLFDAAAGHSYDMATQNYFSHTSLDGRTAGQRISAAGYGWTAYGENIAAGQGSVGAVMGDWMSSPGHCSNIMNGNFTNVAVACVSNSSATYNRYWTMNLGRQ